MIQNIEEDEIIENEAIDFLNLKVNKDIIQRFTSFEVPELWRFSQCLRIQFLYQHHKCEPLPLQDQ